MRPLLELTYFAQLAGLMLYGGGGSFGSAQLVDCGWFVLEEFSSSENVGCSPASRIRFRRQ